MVAVMGQKTYQYHRFELDSSHSSLPELLVPAVVKHVWSLLNITVALLFDVLDSASTGLGWILHG